MYLGSSWCIEEGQYLIFVAIFLTDCEKRSENGYEITKGTILTKRKAA